MKVSIILPVYNGGQYIKEAIKSIQAQSFSDWELLIINDGSSDNTDNILKSINDPRLKIINNSKNIGLQASLNIGLHVAQGEFIARIDADDTWITTDKLEKQISWLEEKSDHILIGSGWQVLNQRGEKIGEKKPITGNQEIKKKLLDANQFCHSSVAFRKKEALAVGGYSQSKVTKYQEDYDLWLRLGRQGEINNLSDISVSYLDTNTGEARKNNKKHYLYFKLGVFLRHGLHYPGLGSAVIRWFYHWLFFKQK